MPHIDLTIPIVILCAAFINVLLIRAYAAWGDRRIQERTDAWLATEDEDGPRIIAAHEAVDRDDAPTTPQDHFRSEP